MDSKTPKLTTSEAKVLRELVDHAQYDTWIERFDFIRVLEARE